MTVCTAPVRRSVRLRCAGLQPAPCAAGETCDEAIDECVCDVEWDLDEDCDVDKYDDKILSLRQKNEILL